VGPLRNLGVHHMDVKCALFNGELSKEVYMMKQKRFKVSKTKQILMCKLKKSIYGLK
jgi:hypothetical protein